MPSDGEGEGSVGALNGVHCMVDEAMALFSVAGRTTAAWVEGEWVKKRQHWSRWPVFLGS